MLADFIVTIHNARKPLAVQIKVHENVKTLRKAGTRHARKMGLGSDADFSSTLGLCHRFHTKGQPLCSIVRLAPPHLGVGIISHELAHVAVWMREIENKFEEKPLSCSDDEWFCWVLGELVGVTVNKLYEYGLYDALRAS